jgi:RNA polymerase sigma-B factor
LTSTLAAFAERSPQDPQRAVLRAELVTGYLPVARHLARRYARRGEPLEDLEQVAGLALVKALDRFDPARGHQFLSYATPTITGELRRHFRDRTWLMRVPRRFKDLHVTINATVGELSQQLGRAPRPSDIATAPGISTEEVLDALHATQAYRAESLDQPLNLEPGAAALSEVLGAIDTGYEQFTLSHSLAPHLAALPVRERDILVMRFYGNMTQTQIADKFGISQMHVFRLLAAILTHLRQAIEQHTPTPVPPTSAQPPDPSGPTGPSARRAARDRRVA